MKPNFGTYFWLLLTAISLPLYIGVLIVFVKYRRKKPFNNHFFKVCLSMGIFDVLTIIVFWGLQRSCYYGWFGVPQLVMKAPQIWAKVEIMIGSYLNVGQILGVALLAVTRMIAVSFGVELTEIRMKMLLIGHWLTPAVMIAPQMALTFDYRTEPNTSYAEGVMPYWCDVYYQELHFKWCSALCVAVAVVCGVCAWLMFWSTSSSRRRVEQFTSDASRWVEIKLIFMGVMLLLLTLLCALVCRLAGLDLGPKRDLRWLHNELDMVTQNLYSWSNVYLLLICSKAVREHFLVLLGLESPGRLAVLSTQSRKEESIRLTDGSPFVAYAEEL